MTPATAISIADTGTDRKIANEREAA